ncbi:MAG TPA: D-tyrosyl-tRNA(Tyr) deacylase [Oceanithermus sp.]|nr:D-tyrosyl-tRNA(Tyr) deacylase [Oceanithermus sp.]
MQRAKWGRVRVEGEVVGEIGVGLVALVGVRRGDTPEDAAYLAKKTANLRIFPDETGKMNRSVKEVGGEVLAVSQFTLYAETRKGNRPSFTEAADPALGRQLYELYVELLLKEGLHVETGVFGAMMEVELLNDGPVTILLDSMDRTRPRRAR